jgi:hypothetical protein
MKLPLGFLCSFLLILSSCNTVTVGEGPVIQQSRIPDDFSKLELDIPANLTYIVADSVSLTIGAPKNILDIITTDIDGRTLEIKSTNDYKTEKRVEIIMTIRPLDAIQLNGSGEIRGINVMKGKELKLSINGSGDIKGHYDYRMIRTEINGSGDAHLSGKTEEHKININGSGKAHAEDLIADIYRISINGSGDADIQAQSKLLVKIIGSGNVRYAGEPAISSEITGSGEVKKQKR